MYSAYVLSIGLLFLVICLLKGVGERRLVSDYRTPVSTFSIVIACKNESSNLENLFSSIQKIDYPVEKYEVIFIDDHSTDDTFEKLTEFCNKKNNCRAYHLFCPSKQFKGYSERFNDETGVPIPLTQKSGKKHALSKGIDESLYEWIALTDADCIIHPKWLLSLNHHIQSNYKPSMFIGYSPEIYKRSFQYFKQLAVAINYASTTFAGFSFSCTGRNLTFKKQAFFDVGGYEGLFDYSSGDDKLLLKKFQKNKMKMDYISFPPIFTFPVQDEALKNQNLRRYGKFSMSSLVWQLCKIFIGTALLFIPAELFFFFPLSIIPFLVFITTINVYMMIGCYLHREKIKPIYFIYSVIFPYYLAYQMIYSFFRRWTWKG